MRGNPFFAPILVDGSDAQEAYLKRGNADELASENVYR
jgi:hypothetical protein